MTDKKVPRHLQPQGKFPPVLTFHQAPRRWLVKHALGYRFRRNKRPCPNCGVRGSYKAYGLYWKDIDVRRWLCKWCGYYNGVDGLKWCVISSELTCWVDGASDPDGYTPEQDAQDCGYSPWLG